MNFGLALLSIVNTFVFVTSVCTINFLFCSHLTNNIVLVLFSIVEYSKYICFLFLITHNTMNHP